MTTTTSPTQRLPRIRALAAVTILFLSASALTGCSPAESGDDAAGYDTEAKEWRHHGADLASSKYSPLAQINA